MASRFVWCWEFYWGRSARSALGADQNVTQTTGDKSDAGSLPYATWNVGDGENVIFQSQVGNKTITAAGAWVPRSMNFVNNSGGTVTTNLNGSRLNLQNADCTISFDSGLTFQTTSTIVMPFSALIFTKGGTISSLNANFSAQGASDTAAIDSVGNLNITGGVAGSLTGTTTALNACGFGIRVESGDLAIQNGVSGSIRGDGGSADGISSQGNVSIAGGVSGTIRGTANASQAWGICAGGNLNGGTTSTPLSITGTGSVTAENTGSSYSDDAYAVQGTGINLSVASGGTLSATANGGDAYAVYAYGSAADTVRLYTGSHVTGEIALGSGSDSLILSGSGSDTFNNAFSGVDHIGVTGGTWNFAPAISSGDVTVSGGTLTLSHSNTYTGGTNLNGGTVIVSANNRLGGTSGGLTFNGGTLQYASGFSNSRSITLNSGGGVFDTNGHDATLSGAIGGIGGLTKTGAGTLTLSGDMTYSGGTAIDAGAIRVMNDFSAVGLTHADDTELQIGGGTTTWNAPTVGSNFALTVDGGTLRLTDTFDHTDPNFHFQRGTIEFAGGTNDWNDITPTYGKNISVNGGTLNTNAIGFTEGDAGTISIHDGLLSVSGNADIANGTLNLSGGALTVAGDADFSDGLVLPSPAERSTSAERSPA